MVRVYGVPTKRHTKKRPPTNTLIQKTSNPQNVPHTERPIEQNDPHKKRSMHTCCGSIILA